MARTIYAPAVEVSVNGSNLTGDNLAALQSLKLSDELNVPTMFEMRFSATNFGEASWQAVNLDTFKPGDEIKIAMGLEKPVPMAVCEVAGVDPTFGDCSFVVVRGYDRLYRLSFGTKLRAFSQKSDSQIAAEMARDAKLTASVEETGVKISTMIQNNNSDLEFLSKRVKQLDYEMRVDNKTFYFQKTREGRSPVAELEYAVDFDDLDLSMKVVNEGSKVNVVGWDVKTKKLFDGKTSGAPSSAKMGGEKTGYQVSSRFPTSEVTLTDLTVSTPASAKKLAEAESRNLLNQFIEGGGSCDGDPRLRAGANVKITGVGERFSGVYYITSSDHEYDQEQGYRTSFKVRRTGI